LTIDGELDLRDVELTCVLAFDDCVFTDALAFDGLTAPALWLTGCQLPGINADRLNVARNLTVTRSKVDGSCYVRDARIGAQLDLSGSRRPGTRPVSTRSSRSPCCSADGCTRQR
jgi:hypothetical protein